MVFLMVASAAAGCAREDPAPSAAPSMPPAPVADAMRGGGLGPGGLSREAALGPFLSRHWNVPIPPQGSAPDGWAPLEKSLDPASCGACHPQQYADWQTTLHAGAFSPGFAGQLIEGGLASPANVRHCQTCHTPLAEQQPVTATGAPSPHFDRNLRAQGMVCATCHVRGNRRLGPPRRSGLPALAADLPHGGFEVRPEFEDSRFCGQCHQFFGQRGPGGRPVQNTLVEWQQSPFAERGETCQRCHMPDRAHLWRGIHDPDTVRDATRVTLVLDPSPEGRVSARLALRSVRVGHMLPTYVTPRIFLEVFQVDASGAAIPSTTETSVIGRQVDFATNVDVFDTRVAPGGTATLAYRHARAAGAAALLGRVTVDPDFHYRGVFASYLPGLTDPEARRLIAAALERASDSVYVLAESRVAL